MMHPTRANSSHKLFLLHFALSLKFSGFSKTVLTPDSYYPQQGLKSAGEYGLIFCKFIQCWILHGSPRMQRQHESLLAKEHKTN